MFSVNVISLQFISHNRRDVVDEGYETLNRINNMNIWSTFMLIPAHRVIKGNGNVDKLARQNKTLCTLQLVYLKQKELSKVISCNLSVCQESTIPVHTPIQ